MSSTDLVGCFITKWLASDLTDSTAAPASDQRIKGEILMHSVNLQHKKERALARTSVQTYPEGQTGLPDGAGQLLL